MSARVFDLDAHRPMRNLRRAISHRLEHGPPMNDNDWAVVDWLARWLMVPTPEGTDAEIARIKHRKADT